MVLGAPALAQGGMGESGRKVKWLPYHRFEIISPLKPQEALRAIATRTEPATLFRLEWPRERNEGRFQGAVTADGFSVTRIMGYRNSFAPVVRGVVKSGAHGSVIQITMRPHVFVSAFILLWCAVMIAVFWSVAWYAGLATLVFMYAFAMGGFWYEAAKQEQTLRTIFKAHAAGPNVVS